MPSNASDAVVTTNPKPRRFATACDECSRRKVKCDAATPSCKHCVRRGTQCTYTRAEPDLHKPRRAARQLKVVNQRLAYVEALLAEARKTSSTTDSSTTNDDSGQEATRLAINTLTDDDDILRPPISYEVLVVLELFFEQVNHFFPMFDKMPFCNKMVQPNSRNPEDAIPLRACVHAMISNAYRMANFSANNDRTINVGEEADKHLTLALKYVTDLTTGRPSLLRVQALICISMSMAHSSNFDLDNACSVFAPAIRQLQMLDLISPHQPPSDRASKIAYNLYWMAYIWDQNLSLYQEIAPMQIDMPSFTPDPVEILDAGKISSLDGTETVNFFHARQRLACLQDEIYTTLRSPKAKTTSPLLRTAAFNHLDAELFNWGIFYLPNPKSMEEHRWPATVYVHIVRLWISHFYTLLAIHDSEITDVKKLEAQLDALKDTDDDTFDAFRAQLKIPGIIISASRTIYDIVRSIGKGGLPWLIESLRLVPVATILLLQAVILDADAENARRDFDKADSWIEVIKHVAKHSPGSELEAPFALIRKLRAMIVIRHWRTEPV